MNRTAEYEQRDTRNKRTPFQREADRATISEMYLRRYPLKAIVDWLNIFKTQVFYDVQVIIKRWHETQINNIRDAIAVELEKINLLEHEAWMSWEKSKQPAESEHVEKSSTGQKDKKGNLIEHKRATKTRRGQTGDVSYLGVIRWCIETRISLLQLTGVKILDTTASEIGGQKITLDDLINMAVNPDQYGSLPERRLLPPEAYIEISATEAKARVLGNGHGGNGHDGNGHDGNGSDINAEPE